MSPARRLLACCALLLSFVFSAVASEPRIRFAPPGSYPIGVLLESIAAGDLNGDGRIDLVTIDKNSASVFVMLGNGDGTFQAPVPYSLGDIGTSYANAIAVADVNGDARMDVLVTTSYAASGGNMLLALLGNGDGSLQSPIASSAGAIPTSIAVADVSGDGKTDVFVGGLSSPALLLGNGDGTFAQVSLNVPVPPFSTPYIDGVAIADVNGDGKLDLLGGDGPNRNVIVWPGNGDGTFQQAFTLQIQSGSKSTVHLGAVDLAHNGKLDIVTADSYGNPVSHLIANADGTYQPFVETYGGTNPIAVASADFNGDGIPDVVFADLNNSTVLRPDYFGISVIPGAADGTLDFGYGFAQFGANLGASNLVIADFNGDGLPDVATSNLDGTVAVLLNGLNTDVTATATGTMSSPTPPGQATTFTVTVAQNGGEPIPTGTVTLLDTASSPNPVVVGTGTLDSNGIATLSVTLSETSNYYSRHDMQALYSGDANYVGSASDIVFTYVGETTTTALQANPMSADFGSSISFTATVTAQGATPTGYVHFYDNNTHIGSAPLNGGVAVFSTAKLAVGGHTIKAYYTPDAASASLVSSETTTMVTITQGMAASNTVMTVDAHLALSPSTLTATVTSASGTPTGTVDFSDGSTALGSVTLNSSGVATYTAPFTGGSHTFTATYSGDASFSPSGAAATATIPREYSTTSLSIAAGANAFSPTTFTATVTTTVGTPTGSVTFRDGATELGTATLSNGVATLSVNVSGGDHINVAAVYGGDTNVEGSSGSASVTIAKATSNTSLSITAGASAFSPSTLTATVSAAVGVPSGTVTFKDGVTTLGSAPVSTGIATLAMNLSAGVHSNVTAVYGGDSDFDGSSGAASVTIPLLPSSTSLALSPNPTAGGKLTLTATVSASVAPAGTVTFRDGATVINTVNVSNGAATLDIFGLVAGSYSFTASFSGAGFSDSSSTAQNLTVAQDFAPPAPASNALTVSPGGTATLALNIAPEPGGFTSTVTLACSGAPTGATCSISPSTVTPGSNGASATLTLTTTGNSAALHSSPRAPLFALWLPLAGIGLCGAGFGRKRRWALLAVIALLALPVMIACGGGGSSSASTTPSTPTTPTTQGSTTPSGTYALTVTATSGSIQHSTVINLTVK